MKLISFVLFGLLLLSASAFRRKQIDAENFYQENDAAQAAQAAQASSTSNVLSYSEVDALPDLGYGYGLGAYPYLGGYGGYLGGYGGLGGYGLGLGGLDSTNFYQSSNAAQAAYASSSNNVLSYQSLAADPFGLGYGLGYGYGFKRGSKRSNKKQLDAENFYQENDAAQAAEASSTSNVLSYNEVDALPDLGYGYGLGAYPYYGGYGLGGYGLGGLGGLGLGGLDSTNFYQSSNAAQAAYAASTNNVLSYQGLSAFPGIGYGYGFKRRF